MSEKEKKRNALYRKNREKWIFAQSVIIAVITVAIVISSIVAYQLNKTYYINYRESGSIDYNVFLKDNEFFEESYLGKDQSYVASLIDRIIADYSYEIDMDADDVNYKYSYTVTSRLEIIDDTSKVAIFNPERELVSVQNKSHSSSNRLRINEIVVINYDEYNDLANKFLETYGLTNTTSSIVVTLSVDVLSDCNAFSGSSVDTYTSELRIPLTTKTVNIKMTSAVPDDEAKMIACTRGAGSEVFKTTAIVLGVLDALLILLLIAFISLTRTADITYTARVKKIVSQYKSYIQKINNLFQTHGYQVILVDTFDEMLEIRDTIQAPILMYENGDKTCAKFMIPTDSKLLYLYEIKIDGYADPEPEPRPDPTPTTIVKPNITNVVRPVVKVVVTPPTPADPPAPSDPEPEIETIVEDAEIEVESEGDSVPEVLVITENADAEPDAEPDAELDAELDAALEIVPVVEDEEPPAQVEDAPEAMETIASTEEDMGFEDDVEDDLIADIDGRTVQFRYRRSFQSRLIQSDDKVKGFYSAIKNKLLSYKGVKARTSWSFESCNKGRIQCAKLNVRGRALLVYLNLDTEQYNVNKYHFRFVGDKVKFAEVPMLIKVKSDRGLKYALELIEEMMNVLEIPEGEIQNVEYDIPYKTTEQLIEEGLIKVVPSSEILFEEESEKESAIDEETESILAAIPTADDSIEMEAIDVFLKKGSNETHSYNPDGNAVEAGDVVLVPTRDEENDKDVVCEAEVARGNYKVDPATLDRPLQKIIGVVRRKAEQIFAAMINPVEENEDQN